jgi:hypothetical protein
MSSRFIDVSSALLAQGYRVRFRATGESMDPAISGGDHITLGPPRAGHLTPGAVVAYRLLDRLFVHRVVCVGIDAAGRERVLLRGDALSACDTPIAAGQVVGEVVAVKRIAEARRVLGILTVLRRLMRSGCRKAVMRLSP